MALDSVIDQSITQSTAAFLNNDNPQSFTSQIVASDTISIIERAQAEGLTLQQYVCKDPDVAIKEAEASLAEWLKIQASAAIEGQVQTEEGAYQLNKNSAKMIQLRVDAAQQHLDKVNEYCLMAYTNGEKRKDHIIRALYNRGINQGDTKALIYLIDRVDGRPGESRVADLDYDNAFNVYQIIHTLFDKQLEVLNSGNGTKLICTSRRSGKTHMLAALCLMECLRVPNMTSIYIGETMEQTELLIDGALNQIIDTCKLRDKRGKRLNWKHMDNGSRILVRGLSNTKDPDLIRGNKAKVIVIDEFFHLKGELLNYLVQEVLQPMQLDYANDYKFICAGTPPSIKATYGEHAWKSWSVPHFYWTYLDNPHPVDVEARKAYVERVAAEQGLSMDSPKMRREYGGEWIYDDDLLLYPEFHCYDPRESIPSFHIDMVLFGLDYGVSDNDTLIGIAWDTSARRGYVFHEDKFNRLDIKDRTISQLQFLQGQVLHAWEKAIEFFPGMDPKEANKRILWDADDNDQHVTDHLNLNIRLDFAPSLRLNIQNAHKTDKVMMHDKIRDLLRTASLLLIKDGKTARECEQTVLKRGPNGQVYPEIDDKVFHPDLLPGMRYALWNVIGQEAAKKEY